MHGGKKYVGVLGTCFTLVHSKGVLTVVYDSRDYWVLGLRPSSGILEASQHNLGNWICFRPQVKRETFTLLGPLESY
jgi:hypothetical protein